MLTKGIVYDVASPEVRIVRIRPNTYGQRLHEFT